MDVEAMPRASELCVHVGSADTYFTVRARFARAAAALILACTAIAATAAPLAPVRLKWTGGLSLAAFGAAFAFRRPRPLATEAEADAPLALPGEIVVRHRIDGRVTFVEGVTADPEALAGYGLVDRLHAEDRPRFLDQLVAVAADGETRATTVRMGRGEADFRMFDVVSRRGEGAGALISTLRESVAARDLSAQLDAAREEARLERSLKDRLLANMSHELRTPLNAILGFSEILGDPALSPTDPDKRLEYARIIHSSAGHLLSVVNLVLDMSRIEAGKFSVSPEPLELAPLLRECCDMLRLRASTGKVEIVVSPLADGLEIVADKAACRQILVNLLSNAVKFTPPNGRVIVEADVEAGVARIAVTDTGIGIKPDDLPRLGDPFFQIKSGYDRSFEGAGLGLSLVRGLVGLHDGSLILESAVGVGTRVTALLPMTIRPASGRANSARLETIPKLTLPALALEREERRIA